MNKKITNKYWCPGDYNAHNLNTLSEYFCDLSWYDENKCKHGELHLKCKWDWKKTFFSKKKIITFMGFENIPKWLDEDKLKEALGEGAYSDKMYDLMKKYEFFK